MNSEDQELLEIEKMLETMKEIEPVPELRGKTLSQARKAWQNSSNFSYIIVLKWAAVAVIIFSIGYLLGMNKMKSNDSGNGLDVDTARPKLIPLEQNKKQETKQETKDEEK